MIQKIIAYLIIAVSFFFFFRWIYRFFKSGNRGKSSVPEKCRSCPQFKGCSEPDKASCGGYDEGDDTPSCCS